MSTTKTAHGTPSAIIGLGNSPSPSSKLPPPTGGLAKNHPPCGGVFVFGPLITVAKRQDLGRKGDVFEKYLYNALKMGYYEQNHEPVMNCRSMGERYGRHFIPPVGAGYGCFRCAVPV